MKDKPDQIHQLRLDVAAALGWTEVRWVDEGSDEGTHFRWLAGRRPDGCHDWDEVPNWPEDIAAAWELLHDKQVRISNKAAVHACWWCYVGNSIGQGDTAPIAICRAWLNAMRRAATNKELRP